MPIFNYDNPLSPYYVQDTNDIETGKPDLGDYNIGDIYIRAYDQKAFIKADVTDLYLTAEADGIWVVEEDGKMVTWLEYNTVAQGVTGPTGTDGIRGLSGRNGYVGTTGATGATGASGPRGGVGRRGDRGPKGLTGEIGKMGRSVANETDDPDKSWTYPRGIIWITNDTNRVLVSTGI